MLNNINLALPSRYSHGSFLQHIIRQIVLRLYLKNKRHWFTILDAENSFICNNHNLIMPMYLPSHMSMNVSLTIFQHSHTNHLPSINVSFVSTPYFDVLASNSGYCNTSMRPFRRIIRHLQTFMLDCKYSITSLQQDDASASIHH